MLRPSLHITGSKIFRGSAAATYTDQESYVKGLHQIRKNVELHNLHLSP